MKPLTGKHLQVFLLIIFFVFQYFRLKIQTQSFNFADENEHTVIAWEIIDYKKNIYRDITTVHQPFPVLISLPLLKYIPYDHNLFMLIERTRQYMLTLSFLGALILVFRFSYLGLVSSLLVETIKFYFFGFHLLGESIIIYPLLMVTGLVLERLFEKNSKIWKIDDLNFGLCLFVTFFSWIQAFPFLLFSLILYLRHRPESGIRVFLSFFISTLILFIFINPFLWFEHTILNVIKYLLPLESQVRSLASYPRFLFYPFLGLFNLDNKIAAYFFLLSLWGIISLFFITGKNKLSMINKMITFYLLVILLNLRVTSTDIAFYSAFHVLPLTAAFTFFIIYFTAELKKHITNSSKKKFYTFTFGCFLIILVAHSSTWWWEKKDKINEHFIQYGEQESIGMVIEVLKDGNDTLLAGPQEGYINFAANIPHATHLNAYLPWSYRSEKIKSEILTSLQNSPPTFIYFPKSDNPYYQRLVPLLEKYYIRVLRKNNAPTNLYLQTTKVEELSENQLRAIEKLDYLII